MSGRRGAGTPPDYQIVVMGGSLGGTQAVSAVLRALPADFTLPIVVALHRGKESGEGLPQLLRQGSVLPVVEAEDKSVLAPGCVYVAPANYHLLIEDGSLSLAADPPVQHARPSIDVLFQSASEAYRRGAIGLILTGASEDGARGLASIARRGGLAVVQEPSSAESPVLPDAAIGMAPCARVLPLSEIGPFLAETCRTRR